MKKQLSVLLCLCLICAALCACGENPAQDAQGGPASAGSASLADRAGATDDVSPAEAAGTAGDSGSVAGPAAGNEPPTPGGDAPSGQAAPVSDESDVDFDLTKMGSTMAYAEVTNILSNPDDYMGKTIRVRGSIYNSYFEKTDRYYQYVIIGDASACCQQGLEFVWKGDHVYPDDYPEDNTQIEITGVYSRYEELDIKYCYIEVDEITVLNK